MNAPDRRILYVITDLEVGGVPLHLERLATRVRDAGWSPAVTCLSPRGPVADAIEAAGIEVEPLNARGTWDVRCLFRLARVIEARQPALVHSLLFHANIAARLAAAWTSFPVDRLICEIQTIEIERRWHLTVDRWTHHFCGIEIGNSAGVVDHLATRARLPRSMLRLVHGGVDVERIASAAPATRASIGAPPDAFLWLWVGRLDPIKGLDTLIDAIARQQHRSRQHLAIVGDGPERKKIEAQIDARGAGAHVSLLGRRDDVPALLNAADGFAFPSRTEGFPNALLEAMAADLPCVASDIPACRELIEHGVSGWLVPPNDVEAWLSGLQHVVDHADEASRAGTSAGLRVREHFTLRECVARYCALYDERMTRPLYHL